MSVAAWWWAACFVLIIVQSPSSVQAARALLQSDGLSNSNGCLEWIPKCEQGACATRNIMGTARWVCLRCLANYEPVVDSSGQNNILQCVCPRGFYEPAPNGARCNRCDTNNFCPGGDKVEVPISRGNRFSCGPNLVTRNTGARAPVDCVAPAGFAQTSPGAASPCARSEYAPQFNRLARCLRCQSGLEEPTESGLLQQQRSNKKDVCKVPPGRFMSQGLVRWCPQGFYRENHTNYDAAVSQICLACKPGITTQGAGAKFASECNTVLPGYGIQTLDNISSADQIPALPANAGGLPEASLCGIGFYSAGGYCISCPFATVTRTLGAKAVEECVVPPGYFISAAAATLAPCSPGSYRERWVMLSDPRAQACTLCGQGIQSEARDMDEHPLAINGSYARATSASCFIEAGQGIIATGFNAYSAGDCPANTYGAAGKVYGLIAAPCKPCPRNMITDGLTRVNNSDACINPDGFGYASEGASRCAPGFYSLKGSRRPCQRCPYGRTTANDPALQRLFTDCYVREGFGLVSSSGNTTDSTGYITDPSGLTDELAAVMPVLECPIGYWGAGLSIRAVCTQCPAGSTTEEVARTAVDQCSICVPGYGIWEGSACTPCNYGWYHPGGDTRCTQCPVATFYPPVDGVGDAWPSLGTTFFKGSQGIDFCVPRESQLSPDAGQIYFSAAVLPELTTAVPVATLADCIRVCPQGSGCLVQFDASKAAAVCYYAALPWDPEGPSSSPGTKLKYKLPPSTLVGASNLHPTGEPSTQTTPAAIATLEAAAPGLADHAPRVRAKMMSSGFYARLAINADMATSWHKAGVPLDLERAQTFKWGAAPEWDQGKSEAECQRKCDDSVVCWGFLYDTTAQACMYKGGEDALSSRSFFVMPNMTAAAAPGESIGGVPIPPVTPSPSPSPPPSHVRKVCFTPSGPAGNTTRSVVEARYRISHTGWDLGLLPRSQTTQGQFKERQMGTQLALSGVTFAFELSYTAGSGYTFSIATGTPQVAQLTFNTSDGTLSNVMATNFTNAIRVTVQASSTTTQTSSATLTNLAFTLVSSPDPVPFCGSLSPQLTASTPGSNSATQWLVSDTDLSLASWKVTGSINLSKSYQSGDEHVKLSIWANAVSPVGVSAVTGSCANSCSS